MADAEHKDGSALGAASYSRRRFLGGAAGLGLLAAAGPLAAACGSSGGSSAAGGGTLNAWTWQGGQPYVQVFKDAAQRFSAAHPTHSVNLQSVDYGQYFTKFQTATAGGVAPDLLEMAWAGQYVDLIRANTLAPLDAELSSDFPAFFPNVMSTLQFFGKTWAVPIDVNTLTVGYNKQIFDKLRLTPPTTHAEMVALAQPLRKAGYQPLSVAVGDGWPAGDMWFAQMAYLSPDGSDIHAAESGKMPWTSSVFTEAASRVQQLKPLLASGASSLTTAEAVTLFAQQKAAMFYPIGNFITPLIDQQAGSNLSYGIFPFPPPAASTAPRATGGAAVIMSVSSKSKNKEAAVEYLRTIMDKQGLADLVKNGYFPATPAANLSANTNQLYLAESKYQQGAATRAIFLPKTYAALLNGMQALLTGSESPQQLTSSMSAAAKTEPTITQKSS